MLEDIDFVCEVLRILMEACTDNGNDSLKTNNNVLNSSIII